MKSVDVGQSYRSWIRSAASQRWMSLLTLGLLVSSAYYAVLFWMVVRLAQALLPWFGG